MFTSLFPPELLRVHPVRHPVRSQHVVCAQVVFETTGARPRGVVAAVPVVAECQRLVEGQPHGHLIAEVLEQNLEGIDLPISILMKPCF